MELKQSKIWDKRHFKLMDDGVWLRIKTPTEDGETKIKYEELGLEIHYVRKKAASFVFGGLIFLSTIVGRLFLKDADLQDTSDIVLLVLFFVFLFGVLFLCWSDSRKPLVSIFGGAKSIGIIRNSPDDETVDKFVNELLDRIKNRNIELRVKPNNPDISFEYKKHMLNTLLEENIINKDKYNQILVQISAYRKARGFSEDFFELN